MKRKIMIRPTLAMLAILIIVEGVSAVMVEEKQDNCGFCCFRRLYGRYYGAKILKLLDDDNLPPCKLSAQVTTLINQKADVNIVDNNGLPLLHRFIKRAGEKKLSMVSYDTIALYIKSERLISLFLEASPDVNKRSTFTGNAALHVAVKNRSTSRTIIRLLNSGARIDQLNKSNETPLRCLFNGVDEYRYVDNTYLLAKVLLQYGANPDSKDVTGNSAWDMTKRTSNKRLKKLVAQHRKQ